MTIETRTERCRINVRNPQGYAVYLPCNGPLPCPRPVVNGSHPAPAADCPQCGETSCDCTPMCLARFDDNCFGVSWTYICELPPDHDGTHRDGSATWSEEEES